MIKANAKQRDKTMKRKMTKKDAEKIWNDIIERRMKNGSLQNLMKSMITKLSKLKFTYDGKIKETRRSQKYGTIADRKYLYADRHFPTLLKEYKIERKKFKEALK